MRSKNRVWVLMTIFMIGTMILPLIDTFLETMNSGKIIGNEETSNNSGNAFPIGSESPQFFYKAGTTSPDLDRSYYTERISPFWKSSGDADIIQSSSFATQTIYKEMKQFRGRYSIQDMQTRIINGIVSGTSQYGLFEWNYLDSYANNPFLPFGGDPTDGSQVYNYNSTPFNSNLYSHVKMRDWEPWGTEGAYGTAYNDNYENDLYVARYFAESEDVEVRYNKISFTIQNSAGGSYIPVSGAADPSDYIQTIGEDNGALRYRTNLLLSAFCQRTGDFIGVGRKTPMMMFVQIRDVLGNPMQVSDFTSGGVIIKGSSAVHNRINSYPAYYSEYRLSLNGGAGLQEFNNVWQIVWKDSNWPDATSFETTLKNAKFVWMLETKKCPKYIDIYYITRPYHDFWDNSGNDYLFAFNLPVVEVASNNGNKQDVSIPEYTPNIQLTRYFPESFTLLNPHNINNYIGVTELGGTQPDIIRDYTGNIIKNGAIFNFNQMVNSYTDESGNTVNPNEVTVRRHTKYSIGFRKFILNSGNSSFSFKYLLDSGYYYETLNRWSSSNQPTSIQPYYYIDSLGNEKILYEWNYPNPKKYWKLDGNYLISCSYNDRKGTTPNSINIMLGKQDPDWIFMDGTNDTYLSNQFQSNLASPPAQSCNYNSTGNYGYLTLAIPSESYLPDVPTLKFYFIWMQNFKINSGNSASQVVSSLGQNHVLHVPASLPGEGSRLELQSSQTYSLDRDYFYGRDQSKNEYCSSMEMIDSKPIMNFAGKTGQSLYEIYAVRKPYNLQQYEQGTRTLCYEYQFDSNTRLTGDYLTLSSPKMDDSIYSSTRRFFYGIYRQMATPLPMPRIDLTDQNIKWEPGSGHFIELNNIQLSKYVYTEPMLAGDNNESLKLYFNINKEPTDSVSYYLNCLRIVPTGFVTHLDKDPNLGLVSTRSSYYENLFQGENIVEFSGKNYFNLNYMPCRSTQLSLVLDIVFTFNGEVSSPIQRIIPLDNYIFLTEADTHWIEPGKTPVLNDNETIADSTVKEVGFYLKPYGIPAEENYYVVGIMSDKNMISKSVIFSKSAGEIPTVTLIKPSAKITSAGPFSVQIRLNQNYQNYQPKLLFGSYQGFFSGSGLDWEYININPKDFKNGNYQMTVELYSNGLYVTSYSFQVQFEYYIPQTFNATNSGFWKLTYDTSEQEIDSSTYMHGKIGASVNLTFSEELYNAEIRLENSIFGASYWLNSPYQNSHIYLLADGVNERPTCIWANDMGTGYVNMKFEFRSQKVSQVRLVYIMEGYIVNEGEFVEAIDKQTGAYHFTYDFSVTIPHNLTFDNTYISLKISAYNRKGEYASENSYLQIFQGGQYVDYGPVNIDDSGYLYITATVNLGRLDPSVTQYFFRIYSGSLPVTVVNWNKWIFSAALGIGFFVLVWGILGNLYIKPKVKAFKNSILYYGVGAAISAGVFILGNTVLFAGNVLGSLYASPITYSQTYLTDYLMAAGQLGGSEFQPGNLLLPGLLSFGIFAGFIIGSKKQDRDSKSLYNKLGKQAYWITAAIGSTAVFVIPLLFMLGVF